MNDKLTERFIKGLQLYNVSYEDIKEWSFCGGSKQQGHQNYWKMIFHDQPFPAHEDHCICGHAISENCYITNQTKDTVLVLGNCCIKRFLNKSGRTCEKCGQAHKNRKDNVCNSCRVGECKSCHSECKYGYELCLKCSFKVRDEAEKHKRTYFKVPYSKKDDAKALGARWDNDKKQWFAIERQAIYDLSQVFDTYENKQ